MSKDFSYTLEKHIATLSESDNGDFTTELNIISYNGASPKIDIRKWDRRTDKMLKVSTNSERILSLVIL